MAVYQPTYKDPKTGRVKKQAVWWYNFTFAGRRIQESSKSTRKTIAKEAEKNRRLELEKAFAGVVVDNRQNRINSVADAVKAYNAVLEQYAGNPKAPAAQLRKGLALLQLNKKDAGIHELRSLIQRHPQTPEAAQARSKLNGMGVRIAAKG